MTVQGLMDYHVHSVYSVDARSRIEEYCRRAVQIGLKSIVFTEHFDLQLREEGFGHFKYEDYTEEIEVSRSLFPSLAIKKGLELGEPHLYQEEIKDYLSGKEFDFLLGSVHWVKDVALHLDYCSLLDSREAYAAYFDEVLKAVRAGGFHVLGHLDLLKRYAPPTYPAFCPEDYEDQLKEIVRLAATSGIGLEINASGLRQRVGESFPAAQVLQWYREMGGELITLGSDAHHVNQLGSGINKAAKLARELGFPGIATFSAGKTTIVPFTTLF